MTPTVMQQRICIECKKIYGCVVFGKKLKCVSCPCIEHDEMGCALKTANVDVKIATGGYCDGCWAMNRLRRKQRKNSL